MNAFPPIAICVVTATFALFGIMFTSHFWAWRFVPSFRTLKKLEQSLRKEQINGGIQPLAAFVQLNHYGDKVVIYHHCRHAVNEFIGSAVRRGAEAMVMVFLLLVIVAIVIMSVLQNGAVSDVVKTVSILIGATDVFAAIWFFLQIMSVEKDVNTYISRLKD